MKQFILYASALLCMPMIAMESGEEQLRDFNNLPIIQEYRDYALSKMRLSTPVFLNEFPNDPKSKTLERYLFQLSCAASIYKYINQTRGVPEAQGPVPQEIRLAYRMVPSSAFIYHIIVRNEIVDDESQLPYDHHLNPMQAWKQYLDELEIQMVTELENQDS